MPLGSMGIPPSGSIIDMTQRRITRAPRGPRNIHCFSGSKETPGPDAALEQTCHLNIADKKYSTVYGSLLTGERGRSWIDSSSSTIRKLRTMAILQGFCLR